MLSLPTDLQDGEHEDLDEEENDDSDLLPPSSESALSSEHILY